MLGRLWRHLRHCWWQYSGHYGSNMAIAEDAAFDVDTCMLEVAMTIRSQHDTTYFSIFH